MIYSAQCCAKWISYPCVYLFKVLRMLRIANTLFHSKSQEALELKRWWRGNVVGKNNNKSAIRGHATKDTGPFLVFTMKRDFLLYLKFHQVLNFIFCFLKLKAQICRMAEAQWLLYLSDDTALSNPQYQKLLLSQVSQQKIQSISPIKPIKGLKYL